MPGFAPLLLDILKRHDFHPKKRLGQNFLVDKGVMERIVEAAAPGPEDLVIEIGPGMGALTVLLAQKAKKVLAVELDRKLCEILGEVLIAFNNVEIVQEDIIHMDLKKLLKSCDAERVKVAANLPYYVTTPILMYLLESRFKIGEMVVMVQKEVADRMMAPPDCREYGSLSVAVQYYTRIQRVCNVSPGAFVPQPAVTSTVVKLTVLKKPSVSTRNEKYFFEIVRGAFSQRRKMLSNALLGKPALGLSREKLAMALKKSGIDGMRRGETLSLQEFATLSDEILMVNKR